jgi:hypothetical protein
VTGVYAVAMADETTGGYPVSMRAVALLGLFIAGAVAFILIDIAVNGRLTGGCTDCEDKAAAGA